MSFAHLASQKEAVDGKINLVLLYLKENPTTSIKDSNAYVEQIMEVKRKEFLKDVFIDEYDQNILKPSKKIHLCCMKVFQMFFNSNNLFDSETTLADDIKRSFYLLIHHHKPKPEPFLKSMSSIPNSMQDKKKNNEKLKILTRFYLVLKDRDNAINVKQRSVKNLSFASRNIVATPMKFDLCFIG